MSRWPLIRFYPPLRKTKESLPVRTIAISERTAAEGNGGSDGIVLPMKLVYDGMNSVSYVIQPSFGSDEQVLPLQVDTGSSDLWIASTSCPSSTCGAANGKLYNPNSASKSDAILNINYLAGHASGPIVWDKVTLGGYQIDHQALGAADSVASEPLGAFSGILGLAFPQNSDITSQIPVATGGNPDGAIFASNLFSIGNGAPAAQFISLSLERPGSNKVPSMFGIGRHPSGVVSDPRTIKYSSLYSDGGPQLFWKTTINAITVYVNGVGKNIKLSSNFASSVLPTAVLDTGVPVILANTAITNGIYGALGIGPGADGSFYVPCTTPLNMTITVNGVIIPLHPLDLTQQANLGSSSCIGLIQNGDALLTQSNTSDLVLGVPFMRNVYTVLAFTPPNPNGSFDTTTTSSGMDLVINPRLGLLNLTDPNVAMEEFHTVRVLGRPLSGPGSTATTPVSYHGLSIGLKILIGLLSGFGLLIAVFVAWLLFHRRKWKKSKHNQSSLPWDGGKGVSELFVLKDTDVNGIAPESGVADSLPRHMRSADMMKSGLTSSWTTDDSGWTKVEEEEEDEMLMDEFGLVYFGKKVHHQYDCSGSSARRYMLVGDDDPESTRDSAHGVNDSLDYRDAVYPSSAVHASSRLLDSQHENEIVETGVNVPRIDLPVNSMAGIGIRRWKTSDDFSVDAMSRLSSPGSMFLPIQLTQPPGSVPPRAGLDTSNNNTTNKNDSP